MTYFPIPEGNRIVDRQVDELIGIARAVAADEAVTDAELDLLDRWLSANPAVAHEPLVGDLVELVGEVLLQRSVTTEDRQELLGLMARLTGEITQGGRLTPTTLPLDTPAPVVLFEGREYCFTGTFDFGTRRHCTLAVMERGGSVVDALAKSTNYLVIGAQVTDSWKHSSYGSKIMKAVTWRDRCATSISIVSEAHWRNSLEQRADDEV